MTEKPPDMVFFARIEEHREPDDGKPPFRMVRIPTKNYSGRQIAVDSMVRVTITEMTP